MDVIADADLKSTQTASVIQRYPYSHALSVPLAAGTIPA
jgi:hypothetical protein